MTEYAPSQGISVQNTCYNCALVSEYSPELRCLNCVEDKEGRDAAIAYDLVDEGNMQYGKTMWSRTDEQPSASDWVSSETITKEQTWTTKMIEIWDTDNPFKLIQLAVEFIDKDDPWLIRKEFTPPIAQLMDGGTHEELWELDDYTQRSRERECQWCHILTPKLFNDCQSCDKPLENNLI